ncbi:MAG: hypothetical protein J0I90_04340, partial [Nitrosospira sp.]|nr:hypothetical protein [Nitrosospira sp.]
MDEKNRIIIRRISRNEQTGIPEEEIMRVAPVGWAGRWALYLVLIPVFILLAILGVFFFTAFFALFAVAAAGLALRLWWLRRKLRESLEGREGRVSEKGISEGDYVVIEDAEIVEESSGTDKTSGSAGGKD